VIFLVHFLLRIPRKGRFPISGASSVSLKVSFHSLFVHPSFAAIEKLKSIPNVVLPHHRDADLTSRDHTVIPLFSSSICCLLRRLSLIFPSCFSLTNHQPSPRLHVHTDSSSRQHPARARNHTQPTPNSQHLHIAAQPSDQPPPKTTMINPSRALDAQHDCHLFKLAAETRNQIYDLVFSFESEMDEEGDIELNKSTAAPSNALTRTCQQIHNESHAMFRLKTYDYPTRYNFTIDVPNRESRPSIPPLSSPFFRRLESFHVTWRADEHDLGKPLHLTSYFVKYFDPRYECKEWSVCVKIHDKSWTPLAQSERNVGLVIRAHRFWVKLMMDNSYPFESPLGKGSASELFASAVYKVAYPGPGVEGVIWGNTKQVS